jgi:hypothetical protein
MLPFRLGIVKFFIGLGSPAELGQGVWPPSLFDITFDSLVTSVGNQVVQESYAIASSFEVVI